MHSSFSNDVKFKNLFVDSLFFLTAVTGWYLSTIPIINGKCFRKPVLWHNSCTPTLVRWLVSEYIVGHVRKCREFQSESTFCHSFMDSYLERHDHQGLLLWEGSGMFSGVQKVGLAAIVSSGCVHNHQHSHIYITGNANRKIVVVTVLDSLRK